VSKEYMFVCFDSRIGKGFAYLPHSSFYFVPTAVLYLFILETCFLFFFTPEHLSESGYSWVVVKTRSAPNISQVKLDIEVAAM
jgi:hypothetical protein